MGLDITAYRDLTAAKDEVSRSHSFQPGAAREWTEKEWPGRTEGLGAGDVFLYGEKFTFRAGSYGGYNGWRNKLAHLAGYPSSRYVWENVKRGPFVELINFADNEGVIGPVVAATLAKDFAEYEEKARTIGGWFWDLYRCWKWACEMASDNGAIEFR